MDRSSLLRLLVIFAFALGGFMLFGEKGGGGEQAQPKLILHIAAAPAEQRTQDPKVCTVTGPRFTAELSSQGASLRHLRMTDEKYREDAENAESPPIDLITTDKEWASPLRTQLHIKSDAAQFPYDLFDWEITADEETKCVFRYETDEVLAVKTIAATDRPFELQLDLTITNKAKAPKVHALAVLQSDWRSKEEIEGSFGRQSPEMTFVEFSSGETVERLTPDDFSPDEYEDPDNNFTADGWHRGPGSANWVAVSNSFFSKAMFPLEGPSAPYGETVVEDQQPRGNASNVYLARLSYPQHELKPGESVSYSVLAFGGPKEREVLSGFGGAERDLGADEILDLGIFGAIGKLLVWYLYKLYDFVGTWGWAICLLTITIKLLLFPLSITQIKSAMAMRRLKPEIDELNKKHKDDATQRALAMQELMKKHNVTNPMLGCLPLLLQMPVWYALYAALNSAVELYHVSFGPFIPDLSAPSKFYIIPILLGASSFLQQHLMPMQGDPMQQKMLKYFMPAMFLVFMLFLPAGLGIYFLTNTWLGIGQQLAV
ncbi:MAG: membrane protein insertase YidC, partial [Myxococcota bacterium]